VNRIRLSLFNIRKNYVYLRILPCSCPFDFGLGVFPFFFESRRSFALRGSPCHGNKGTPGIYLRRREDRWGACSAPPPRAAPRSAPLRTPVFTPENGRLFARYFLPPETPILFFCWTLVAFVEKLAPAKPWTWRALPCNPVLTGGFSLWRPDDQTTSDVTRGIRVQERSPFKRPSSFALISNLYSFLRTVYCNIIMILVNQWI